MDRKNRKGMQLVGVFFLALVFFNYPIMSLFNTDVSVFGVPLFYVYLFTGWSLIIILILLIMETGRKGKKSEPR